MILEGDCIKSMKDMADKSIDLCFADPPYNAKNIGPNSRTYTLGQMQIPLEEYKKFCADWFEQAYRISSILILTPGISNMCFYPQPDWCICWSKPMAISFNRFGGFNVWEPIYIYGRIPKGNRLKRDLFEIKILNGFGNGSGIEKAHPCPKPLELMRKLVSIFSLEGETILDPFAGSGTTLRAAKDLGRKFIGIEINPEYVALSNKRVAQEVLV